MVYFLLSICLTKVQSKVQVPQCVTPKDFPAPITTTAARGGPGHRRSRKGHKWSGKSLIFYHKGLFLRKMLLSVLLIRALECFHVAKYTQRILIMVVLNSAEGKRERAQLKYEEAEVNEGEDGSRIEERKRGSEIQPEIF